MRKEDLLRARHRLGKMLLRQGRIYGHGGAWTRRHYEWLRSQSWEHAAERVVFENYLRAIELVEERVGRSWRNCMTCVDSSRRQS